MTHFALYLLKMSLCSGVLYGYYYLALRNRVFHQYNRFYLLAAVLFSLFFPLIPMPFAQQEALPASPFYQVLLYSEGRSTFVQSGGLLWPWQRIAGVLYTTVGLLLLAKLATGLWQIRRLMLQSEVRCLGKINFVKTCHPAAPFSFLNWLFWKRDIELETDGGQAIFRHELVHIQEKHTVDKLLLQVILAAFWINPFFWLMRRELQMIHEFIADKKAVGRQGAAALAAMILQAACGSQYHQLTNSFFQKPIKRRLAMLQKTLNHPQNAYLSRVLSLPLCVLLFFACAKKEEQKLESTDLLAISKPIVTDTIPIDSIAAVNVDTKDSVKTITVTYQSGKKETYTEKKAIEKGLIKPPPPPPPLPNLALLIIDGVEQGPIGDSKKLDAINPEDIESMNVLKDEHAIKKYGAKGKNGVIEIITKKEKQNKSAVSGATSMVPRQDPDIVHIEVDQPPYFPGGETAWRAFLERNLNASIPVEKGAPPGTYPVQVQFKIANDGTISDIRSLSTYGYGMENAVVALIQKSPKWVPAEINNYKVTTVHKQPVTFVVAEE